MAKFITIEHSKLKDKDGKPLRSRIAEGALTVAGGFGSKGWKKVADDKAKG